MAYATEPIPYENSTQAMTEGALKKAFAAVMQSVPRRVERISRYVNVSDERLREATAILGRSPVGH
jgi:hypothetical protein